MKFLRTHWREATLAVLIFANISVWFYALRSGGGGLSVYFLDVGQGDSILIESPTGSRILVDGGKNRQVLTRLGEILPFGDRRIDVVIATHTDADHIGGLPEVVSLYDVGAFLEPGITDVGPLNTDLHLRLKDEGAPVLEAKRGMKLDLGGGAILTVLFPNQDVSWWPSNDASIVSRLTYGDTEFLLTGDATHRTENILLSLDSGLLDVDVLQAGHHGSRTSTSLTWAQAASPEYTVISAGKDNSYGHPHKEVLDVLKQVNSEILITAESGTIHLETDGRSLEVK